MSIQSFSPVQFHCYEKIGDCFESWPGTVTRLVNHGSHYEIYISSRSGFTFIVGKYINGGFISIPAFNVGSDLADYDDYFWNNEHLALIMNRADAATVAEALRTLSTNKFI
ncbi:MAG: hypothetical protein ROZ36_07850 [Thermincola sp.]|jgi:hypothetical protein|nr:hypothetical protein [Thermincola sp.]